MQIFRLTKMTGPTDWDPSGHSIRFSKDELPQLKPGQLVTMTDGANTNEETITNLSVHGANVDNDTVSGDADPGSEVWVNVTSEPGAYRHTIAETDGSWTVDFANPNGIAQDMLFDIISGTEITVEQKHANGCSTAYHFNAQAPGIEASRENNWVKGRGWPVGSVLTLSIDGTVLSPTATVEHNPNNPGDPNDIRAEFDLGGIQLQPGMQLTVTDGTTPRTLTLTALAISAINTENATISGTTDSPLGVRVCVYQPGKCVVRWAVPDGDGHWTVNFRTAGGPDDDPETVELQPGMNGVVDQYDLSSNTTHIDWNVKNPSVQASPGSHWVLGRDWPLGS